MRLISGQVVRKRRRSSLSRFGLAVILAFSTGLPASAADNPPPSPDHSWAPPGLNAYEQALAQTNSLTQSNASAVAVDPGKIYDLPRLIDLAERSNPDTRVAWEKARQAARAVGLSESAYYPYLAASASAASGASSAWRAACCRADRPITSLPAAFRAPAPTNGTGRNWSCGRP